MYIKERRTNGNFNDGRIKQIFRRDIRMSSAAISSEPSSKCVFFFSMQGLYGQD